MEESTAKPDPVRDLWDEWVAEPLESDADDPAEWLAKYRAQDPVWDYMSKRERNIFRGIAAEIRRFPDGPDGYGPSCNPVRELLTTVNFENSDIPAEEARWWRNVLIEVKAIRNESSISPELFNAIYRDANHKILDAKDQALVNSYYQANASIRDLKDDGPVAITRHSRNHLVLGAGIEVLDRSGALERIRQCQACQCIFLDRSGRSRPRKLCFSPECRKRWTAQHPPKKRDRREDMRKVRATKREQQLRRRELEEKKQIEESFSEAKRRGRSVTTQKSPPTPT